MKTRPRPCADTERSVVERDCVTPASSVDKPFVNAALSASVKIELKSRVQ